MYVCMIVDINVGLASINYRTYFSKIRYTYVKTKYVNSYVTLHVVQLIVITFMSKLFLNPFIVRGSEKCSFMRDCVAV